MPIHEERERVREREREAERERARESERERASERKWAWTDFLVRLQSSLLGTASVDCSPRQWRGDGHCYIVSECVCVCVCVCVFVKPPKELH